MFVEDSIKIDAEKTDCPRLALISLHDHCAFLKQGHRLSSDKYLRLRSSEAADYFWNKQI